MLKGYYKLCLGYILRIVINITLQDNQVTRHLKIFYWRIRLLFNLALTFDLVFLLWHTKKDTWDWLCRS